MGLKYLAIIGCIGMVATGWWALDIKVLFLLSTLITIPASVSVFLQAARRSGATDGQRQSRSSPALRGGVVAVVLVALALAYLFVAPQFTIGIGERAQGGYDGTGSLTDGQVSDAVLEAQKAAEDAEAAMREAVRK
ncbi:MAG: hypothetical protein QM586_07000 [Xenophilus sp.]